MHATEIPNFESLTDMERIALAEELFASVRDPAVLPAPIAHQIELNQRWAAYEKNPGLGLTPEQFWKKVETLKK